MTKKKIIKRGSPASILIFSILSGLISAVIMIFLSAFLLVKNDIDHSLIRYFWIVIYFTAGTVGGLVAGRISKSKGFLWGGIAALITGLVILLFSAIMLNFRLDIFIAVLIPVSLLSGVLSGIISANLR